MTRIFTRTPCSSYFLQYDTKFCIVHSGKLIVQILTYSITKLKILPPPISLSSIAILLTHSFLRGYPQQRYRASRPPAMRHNSKTSHPRECRRGGSRTRSRFGAYSIVIGGLLVLLSMKILFQGDDGGVSTSYTLFNMPSMQNAAATSSTTATITTTTTAKTPERLEDLRILLYITTHMSLQHIDFFKHCWPMTLANSRLLQHSDVLVYDNHELPLPYNLTTHQVMNAVFGKTVSNITIVHSTVTEKQLGAHQSMIDAFAKGWFMPYDWIIRLQPDALILNDTFLIDSVLRQHDPVDAILGRCGCSPTKQFPKGCESLDGTWTVIPAWINTDFHMFRPTAVSSWGNNSKSYVNAEHRASDAFGSVLRSGKVAFIENEFGFWRFSGQTVKHSHPRATQCRNGLAGGNFADFPFVDEKAEIHKEFCSHCMFNPTTMSRVTCLARAEYIANRYQATIEESKIAVLQAEPVNCKN